MRAVLWWALAATALAVALVVALAVVASKKPRRCPAPPPPRECPAPPPPMECPVPTECPACPAPTECPACPAPPPPMACPPFRPTSQRTLLEYERDDAGYMAVSSGFRRETDQGQALARIVRQTPSVWYGIRDITCNSSVYKNQETRFRMHEDLVSSLTSIYSPAKAARVATAIIEAARHRAATASCTDPVGAKEAVFEDVLAMLAPTYSP